MAATFEGLTDEEAAAFAADWLPAWTGNDAERLASFYSEDTFYADPGIPDGVEGRAALTEYFTKLLAQFPDWVWTHTRATPIPDGFLNHWHASVPVGGKTLEIDGVCSVRLQDGLISRNEVFFDRTPLLTAMSAARDS